MDSHTYQKILKGARWLLAIGVAASIALFIPAVRSAVIQLGEKCVGRPLTHPVWNARLVSWSLKFLCFSILAFCALHLFSLTIFAEPRISISQYAKNRFSALDFDQRLHLAAFCVFAIVFLRYHAFVSPTTGDPHSYATVLQEKSLFEFLKGRHFFWSSRLLIEALMVNIYRWDGILWRIIGTASLVTIAESIVRLALPREKCRYAFLVYALLFLIPQSSLSDAGWGPTTTNYLWPLAAAIVPFVVIKKLLQNENVSKKETAVSIILAVYAANQEQLAALMFGLALVLFLYKIIRAKKIGASDFYFIAILAICALSIMYMFLCPGNFARRQTEISHWIPPYDTYSFFDKVKIGMMTILTYYFTERHMNFIVVPLCALNAFIVFATYIGSYVRAQSNRFLFSNVFLARFVDYSDFAVNAEVFILFAAFALLVLSAFGSSTSRTGGFLNALILCAGFCSAFILAFSPTVYSSGTRCYLFMTEAIFIVTIRFFAQEEELHFLG